MLINDSVNQEASILDLVFRALADPTRRAILARLAEDEVSVKGLAEPFTISLPAVSRHLKVLERAGLIARGREAQRRPCRLQAGALKEAGDWIERYRRVGEQRIHALNDHVTGPDPRREKVAEGAEGPGG